MERVLCPEKKSHCYLCQHNHLRILNSTHARMPRVYTLKQTCGYFALLERGFFHTSDAVCRLLRHTRSHPNTVGNHTHTKTRQTRQDTDSPPTMVFVRENGGKFSFVCAPSECCLSSACVFALSATNGGNWVCVHVDDYTNNQAGTGFNGRHIILGIW